MLLCNTIDENHKENGKFNTKKTSSYFEFYFTVVNSFCVHIYICKVIMTLKGVFACGKRKEPPSKCFLNSGHFKQEKISNLFFFSFYDLY